MSYVPHELYSVYLYDTDGNLQTLIQKITRIEFHQRINTPWNHQITVELNIEDANVTLLRNLANTPDWIIHIYRIDPVTLIRSLVYEGLNLTVVDQLTSHGTLIFNLYGVGFTDFLRRRIILPPVGEEYSSKTGNAETVIKAYITESMVSPVDSDRVFPGIAVEADAAAGNIVTYNARYTILYSVIQRLIEEGNIDFGIVGDSVIGQFLVRIKSLWGSDRRQGNILGNVPVVFSIENANMDIPIVSTNFSSEQNYAFVGGAGQGTDRVIEEIYDTAVIITSPWARKEFFVEGRQQTDTQALQSLGLLELDNRKAKRDITFNVKQSAQSRWLRDWVLGDLVTAKYFNLLFDKQIVEIGVVVTSGQSAQQPEVITVELETYND